MKVILPSELNEMKALPYWLPWKREQKGKIPYSAKTGRRLSGQKGSAEYMNQLATFEEVDFFLSNHPEYSGIGAVMGGDLCGIDIDNCIDDSGVISDEAEDIIKTLNSYTEISPSGHGIRIIMKGTKEGKESRYHDDRTGQTYEIYDSPRGNYLTITGDVLECKPIREDSSAINQIHRKYIAHKAEPPVLAACVNLTDDAVMALLMKDPTGRELFYSEGINDHSGEDLALCNKLAFYCGKDAQQMDRLFRQSRLFETMKTEGTVKKWDKVHNGIETYGQMTIKKAIEGTDSVYTGNDHSAEEIPQKKEKSRFRMKSALSVQPKEKPFLVPGWIPEESVTVIIGDGGIGKSSITASIVASLSRGEYPLLLGEEMKKPFAPRMGNILLFMAEDSMEYGYKKKLDLSHADMSRIKYVDVDDENLKHIKFNSSALADVLEEEKPMLVVFDPLHAFLPPKVDMNNKVAVSDALKPLKILLTKCHSTALIISHSNKGGQGISGRQRVNGSSDIWDGARSVIFTGEVRDMPFLSHPIYISHEKSNYSETQKTVIAEKKDGIVTFWGRDNRKDRDFQLGNYSTGEQKTVSEQCAEYITAYFEDRDIKEVSNDDLAETVKTLGCYSDNAFRGAKKLLQSRRQIQVYPKGNKSDRKFYVKYLE